jgi:hypothetical protein
MVLGGTLVGLLVGEGIVRIAAPQILSAPCGERILGVNTSRPNMRGRFAVPGAYDVTASVNSQMFRGTKEFQPSPRPGVNRLALLGDSMTFGSGANDDETYPAQLERTFERLVGSRRVEILNAGIRAAGTGEEAYWFDVWVKRFHPRVVALNVFWNDVDDDLARSPFRMDKDGKVSPRSIRELTSASGLREKIRQLEYALPGFIFMDEHSHLVNLVRRVISTAWDSASKDRSRDGLTPLQIDNTRELYRRTDLPLLAGELVWLQERAQDSGATLVVVYLPSREDIYFCSGLRAEETRWKSAAIVRTLKETCLSRGIPFSDLTSQVRKEAGWLPRPLYYSAAGDSMHPNPEGYRVIAAAVAAFLRQEGIVAEK